MSIKNIFIFILPIYLSFCANLSAQIDTLGVVDTPIETPPTELHTPSYSRADFEIFHLSKDFTKELSSPIDTTYLPHRYRIAEEYSLFNADLGNYGLPLYQLNFFDRITDPDQFLYSYYAPFMHTADNAVFMNTKTPYAEMRWSYTNPRSKSEQTFRIVHSQNINRYINFGFIYDIDYDLGQYNYQRATNKTFTFFSSFTGKRYNYYLSTGINNITSRENGGMLEVSMESLEGLETEDVPMRMSTHNAAQNVLKNRNILFVQKLGSDTSRFFSGTLSHIFQYDGNRDNYSDNAPQKIYDNTIFNKDKTLDSLLYRGLKNTLRFDFDANENGRYKFGGGVGIRHEYRKYMQGGFVNDTTFNDTISLNKNSIILLGKLYNHIGDKFSWTINAETYLTGYRSGDFALDGTISKEFSLKRGSAIWEITANVSNTTPSLWHTKWISNNFSWDMKLAKELRTQLGTAFSYPAIGLNVEIDYALIDNYIYFDTNAKPAQSNKVVNVASLLVGKKSALWRFHLDTDLLIQKSTSSKDIIDLPLATAQAALYYSQDLHFKSTGGKLSFDIGADATYHTSYYAYSYMPATGRYYNQTEIKAGNYPYIDIFLNLRLKRARLFLMYEHINWGFMGYNYFEVPYYPTMIRTFRYGFAWTFYN